MKEAPSCRLEDSSKSCCSASPETKNPIDLKSHWDQAYLKVPESKLGWFEQDFGPSFRLLNKCKLKPEEPILLVGSGSSRLPDQLLAKGLSQIVLTDISEVALSEVRDRLGEELTYRAGDILQDQTLEGIPPIQLWFDRALLHFFTEEKDQGRYFKQLKENVKPGGYVIFAEFSLSGAEKCSSLPVFRYEEKMYQDLLGEEFKLLDTFDYSYLMPSGEERPYTYALYQRLAS